MTESVGVITDSIACLPKELIEKHKIEIVPIRLTFGGEIYRDSIDITPSEAYEMLLKDPERFNTSPSSPGHFMEAYRKVSARVQSIICITLSSQLSTGLDMARIAMEEAKTELPDVRIHVMDSMSVTSAEGFIALAAARAAEKGENLEGVIKAAEEVRAKVSFIALLETIKHVYRTGRIPKIASQVGSMLNIKPILTSADGAIKFKGIVKNRESGVNKLIEMLREAVGNHPAHIAIMHAYTPDEAEDLKNRIEKEFNCAELWIAEFTPVMGYATGTGTLALAYYRD
ncbi:MAG TPA: DegV family protein [Dehalococcoidia bacterium]|nr:DegV family protein [Dehalococcoidia bacterium]